MFTPLPETFNAATYFVDRHLGEGRGSRVAIECGDERVTYGQMFERVNRVGNALRSRLQVRVEERVAMIVLDSPEFIYTFFGTIKIGAVPVPLNTLWKTADYEYVLNDSRARVLVISAPLLPQIQIIPPSRLRYLEHMVVIGEQEQTEAGRHQFAALIAFGDAALTPEPTSRDDAAFWLYSSGSTGPPKGCVHLQRDMPYCSDAYARGVLGMMEDDRCFSVAKLFFAYGLGNGMYFPLAVGATTILWPGPPTAADVYAVIQRHAPTLLFSVPTNYGMLLAHTRDGIDFDLSTVRCAVSAGEALPPALYERFRARFGVDILDGIGSTEILHIFISNRRGGVRSGSSGQIVPGYEAQIVDDAGEPVPPGDVGNLLVKGDSICARYWNKHDKTRATIQGEWIRTGDKYYQDKEGYFFYAGRTDDMLKVGGIWVSPIDVENALLEHPAVLECGVVGRADRDRLLKPVAYVVLRDGACGDRTLAAELQQFVRERLAEYKRPRWVEFLPALPKTATGKIQRFKLRAGDAADS